MRVRLRLGVVAHIFYRGKVLLVHRDNLPHITYPDTWDSITESLEKGEDFETGMRRGLLEEIGVVQPRSRCSVSPELGMASSSALSRMPREELSSLEARVKELVSSVLKRSGNFGLEEQLDST